MKTTPHATCHIHFVLTRRAHLSAVAFNVDISEALRRPILSFRYDTCTIRRVDIDIQH